MKRKLASSVALFSYLLAFHTSPALAQRVGQTPGMVAASPTEAPPTGYGTAIAAVVNDNVITTTDIDARMKLGILSSGLPDTPDVRAHLLPQVLRSLIDEQLEVQEAKRLDLSASKEEVDQALEHIAQSNNIAGDMRDFVTTHGGSADGLVTQVKNGLLWNKVIQRELRPHVEIGDDEIDAVIERIRADAGKEEYLVSEIYLPVDSPKDEDQVKQTAENLLQQLKSGANFAAVARQFSQGVGATQGGDMGWVQSGQLSPELNHALIDARAGEISDPIRTPNGYHILGVRDKRTVTLGDPGKSTVNLMQAFHPFAPDGSNRDALMQSATKLRSLVKRCSTLQDTVSASFPEWKVAKLGDMNPSKAPVWLSSKIQGVPAGGASDPLATDKGIVLLFVCSRNEGGDSVDRDAIMRSIGTDKLELQARRLLRDLRRDAYIDVRIGKPSS